MPDRCPIQKDSSNARTSAVALVWSQVCLPAELPSQRAWNHGGNVIDRSRADATLQTVHVRLDT